MSNELRKKWWTVPLGHLVWLLIAGVCATLRKKAINLNGDDDPWGDYQCIIALWHNRVFSPCHVYRYVVKGKLPMSMLTSASKDGAMLATVARDYGMRAVRGSSNRRGAAGFRDMVREMQDGCCMCITPDGPRGPIYKCRPGAVRLASMSGYPIVPACIEYSSYWRIGKAWDGFIIPKPFSRVTVTWGRKIYVPADITEEQQAEYCRKVEEALAYGAPDFPPINIEEQKEKL
mgnify:CR=1 FL=1